MSYQVKCDFQIRDWETITRQAVTQLGDRITARSKEDIAAGGRFGARYQRAYRLTIRQLPQRGHSLTFAFRKPNFLRVFETGGVSRPRGMRVKGRLKGFNREFLWVPVANDSRGVRAGAYSQKRGKLFRPGPRGNPKPVLMASKDRQIKYVGVKQITLKKRFHLRAIAEDEAGKFMMLMHVT